MTILRASSKGIVQPFKQLQMEFRDGPLVTRPSPQSAAPTGFLHKLLDIKSADGSKVDHITREIIPGSTVLSKPNPDR